MDELLHAIGVVVAVAVMQLLRSLARTAFWKRVESRAQRYLDDPNVPANDPDTAAAMALADEQRASLNRIAAKLPASSNGVHDGKA